MKDRARAWARRLFCDRWRRRLLIAWWSLPIVELFLFASDFRPISAGAWTAEIMGLVLIGILHASLAPEDWRGSACWPSAFTTTLVLIRLAHELFDLAFGPAKLVMPLIAIGLVVIAFLTVRLLDRILWRRIPAALLTLSGPVLLWLAMTGPQVLQPFVPGKTPTSNGPPLVVITIDTLRVDMAAGMESWRFMTSRGAGWPKAMSASSWTWPALVSLWSGMAGEDHGSGREPSLKQSMRDWSAELPMLPKQLAAAGYVTAAFATNPVVALMPLAPLFHTWRHGNVIGPPFALTGFPGESSDAGDARVVVDAALDWLDDAPDEGFLLWVHLSEPHLPYRHSAERWDYNLLRNVRSGDWFMGPDERGSVIAAHRREVAYVDGQVMRLLRALETRGLLGRGAVVFTSDHGEEFWEHDGFEHGHSHHGEVVNVPLALIAPGLAPGEREGIASLQDIAPTLRAVAGLPSEGIDLRQPIPTGRVARAWGNAYFRPMHSFRTGDRRIIVDNGTARAYDLAADPAEQHPLPVSAEELEALEARIVDPIPALAPGRQHNLDEDILRSLGYVH